MNDDELTQYVIDRLGQGVGRSDVIHEVCERSAKSWPQAEAFVDQVAAADGEQIAGRTFPLLALVSVATVIGGGALVVLSASDFAQATHLAGTARGTFEAGAAIAWLAQNASALPMGGLGLAMILGGLIGLIRAAQDL